MVLEERVLFGEIGISGGGVLRGDCLFVGLWRGLESQEFFSIEHGLVSAALDEFVEFNARETFCFFFFLLAIHWLE